MEKMTQIIDGCAYVRCSLRKKCYRFTLKRRPGQIRFSYWHGCAHFWVKNQGPKEQVKNFRIIKWIDECTEITPEMYKSLKTKKSDKIIFIKNDKK